MFYAAALAFQEDESEAMRSLLLGSARTFALAAYPGLHCCETPSKPGELLLLEDWLLAAAVAIQDLTGDDADLLRNTARAYAAAWSSRHRPWHPRQPDRRSECDGDDADREVRAAPKGAACLIEVRRGR